MAKVDLMEQDCVPALMVAAYRLLIQDRKDMLSPDYKNAPLSNFEVAMTLLRVAMLSSYGDKADAAELNVLTRGY